MTSFYGVAGVRLRTPVFRPTHRGLKTDPSHADPSRRELRKGKPL